MRRRVSAALALVSSIALMTTVVGTQAVATTEAGVASHRFADPSDSLDYWTEERMRAAKPLPLRPVHPEDIAGPLEAPQRDPLKIPGTAPSEVRTSSRQQTGDVYEGGHIIPFKRFEITDPAASPYVTHGQVFGRTPSGAGFGCSGTVVQSENKSVVWTAAHCLYDWRGFSTDVVFVPGYKDGPSHHGTWAATEIAVTAEYEATESLDHDFGAIVLAPNENGVLIGDAVGMRGIAFDQSPAEFFQSYGYPAIPSEFFDGERMHSCESQGSGRVNGGAISMGCDMQFGSSGGGWIMRGGYLASNQSGGSLGSYPGIAFGPYLGSAARALYDDVRGGTGPLPQPTPAPGAGGPKTHTMTVNLKLVHQIVGDTDFLVAKGRVRAVDGYLNCNHLTPVHVSRFKKADSTYYPVGDLVFANAEGRYAILLPDRPGRYIVGTDESPYDLTNNCATDYSDPLRHRRH